MLSSQVQADLHLQLLGSQTESEPLFSLRGLDQTLARVFVLTDIFTGVCSSFSSPVQESQI